MLQISSSKHRLGPCIYDNMRHTIVLLLRISTSQAAQKASNTGRMTLLLSVAVLGLGATIAKEAAKNTPRHHELENRLIVG